MGYCRFKQRMFAEASLLFNQYRNAARNGTYQEDVYTDAMARLGDSYFMIRKLPEALESYAYVSGKKGPAADYALFQKGMIYGFTRESQQKIATMKRIPNEFPESPFVPDAIFEMASEQLNIGQAKEAERNLMYLVQDFQGRLIVKRAYQTLGQLYYKQEKDDKAIEMYKKLALEYPGTPEAQKAIEKIEKIYKENGRGSEYLAWVATVPNISVSATRRDSIVYASAFNLWERKDYDGAIREFNRYLADFRDGFFLIPAQYHLAHSYERKKQAELSLPFYQKVANAAASEYTEQSLLAIADIMGKNAANCSGLLPYLEKLEQVTGSRDNLLYAVHKQMRCAISSGQGSIAERKAEQLLGLDYTKPEMISEALLVLGRIRYEQKEYNRALDMFQRNFSKFDNQYAAESKYYEALTLYSMDSLSTAKKSVFQFNNQFSSYDLWLAKSFLLLGDIYVKMGDNFSAKATWNSVIANFNDMPEIVAEAKNKLNGLNQPAPLQQEQGGGE
jgi:TolA-binding protein